MRTLFNLLASYCLISILLGFCLMMLNGCTGFKKYDYLHPWAVGLVVPSVLMGLAGCIGLILFAVWQ